MKIKPSRNSRRRALVLLTVHAIIALHILHFLRNGRSLSPAEPSESMYTLELGEINVGFILLLATLTITLIFGRFFCGWACHMVALQDGSAWLLKRVGIKPRPFRSRLLGLAPLVLAFYMFAWPTLERAWITRAAFPGFSDHLLTDSFWKTFPGPVFAVLTFAVCGFAAVYFLGSKGFCTYGCPYGALYGAVERVAPGRILVSDACEQCGHCTATCTSNVRVHEEVARYGRVVDPGCMKCMDCVSVCPKGALRFGFGRPSSLARRSTARPARYPLSLLEELIVGAVALVATLAFRGLYDGPPLLMAVALGAISGYLVYRLKGLIARREFRRPAGALVLTLTVIWLAFTVHSAYVQWHRFRGNHHFQATATDRQAVLAGSLSGVDQSQRQAARQAIDHLDRADAVGLVDLPEIKLNLAWCHLLLGDGTAGEARIREAIALTPGVAAQHDNLVRLLSARGRPLAAAAALEAKIAAVGPTAADLFRMGTLQVEGRAPEQAVRSFSGGLQLDPSNGPARFNLGGLLRRMGDPRAAVEHLRLAREVLSTDADVRTELGLSYLELGATREAIEELKASIELDPARPESRLHLAPLVERLESEVSR